MLLASGISIATIAGAIEEEEYVVASGVANSEANSSEQLNYYDGYITDHTDLGSEIDIDESEYRRELLNDMCAEPTFAVNSSFDSFDVFENALREYELKAGWSFTKKNSQLLPDNPRLKYYEVNYVCRKAGKFIPKGTGQRDRGSQKTDCKAFMKVRANKEKTKLDIILMDLLHNHDKQERWRVLFDRFDPEGFGEIPLEDFVEALKSAEWRAEIPPNKRDILFIRVKESRMQAVTFQDFVNVMSGKRTRSFKCAVHHRDREVCSENDFHILVNEPPLFQRMVRMIGDEFLTEERDRKLYADHYTCCPPPLFIILITLVELAFFTYYTVAKGEVNPSGPVPTDSVFIYRPDKRLELWRFAFYMFLHAGWLHLLFNLGVQLVVGLPLEMVHGSFRIAAVYMAGVLAGSLGTSVFDTDVYLVGASGGVYALLAAHLANVLLNYNNMEFGIVRLVGIFIIASADVGFAIYDRYAAEQMGPPVSYVAHLTGALAGLTIGLLVLKNFEQRLHEQLLWWVALGVYAACTIFAIMYNLMHPDYP